MSGKHPHTGFLWIGRSHSGKVLASVTEGKDLVAHVLTLPEDSMENFTRYH